MRNVSGVGRGPKTDRRDGTASGKLRRNARLPIAAAIPRIGGGDFPSDGIAAKTRFARPFGTVPKFHAEATEYGRWRKYAFHVRAFDRPNRNRRYRIVAR